MSGYVRPALIAAIADSIGISDLSEEVARVLAPDVEYRVRDILQEARKFSRHGCRRRLECLDINHALQARDMEQLYGLHPDDHRRYSRVAGASDAFQIEDTVHRCQDVIHHPLPPPPLEVGVYMHWFLVKGIKPRIPENAVPSKLVKWHQDKIMEANAVETASGAAAAAVPAMTPGGDADMTTPTSVPGAANVATGTGTAIVAALDKSGTPAVLMPIVKHSITEELFELLQICTKVLLEPTEEVGAEHPVFATLAADAGLDAAVPYIVTMIARGARESPHDLPRLWRLLWAAHALIRNQTNNAAAYLSQLLPALLTLLLNNSLGSTGSFEHLRLRRQAAAVLGDVADRYHQPDLNMRARIAATCMKALRRRPVRLCTSYGALHGLQALGGRTLRLLLLPELGDVHNALLPCLTTACVNHRSALKVAEAEQCLSALRDAACAACRQGAAEVASAGLSAAVMARISGLETDVHHVTRISSEARQAKASAIDKRMKELETQAKKALQEGWQLHEQRVQQVQALQRVEAAAKATLENGNPSHTPGRRSSDGTGPSIEAVDPAAAARAAARIAAESFDPARAGGTAIGDSVAATAVTNTTVGHSDTGGDIEVMESPPGSPMFVPPPPKSPVTAPASSTDPPSAPEHVQQPHTQGAPLQAQAQPLTQSHPKGFTVPQQVLNHVTEASQSAALNTTSGPTHVGPVLRLNGLQTATPMAGEQSGPVVLCTTSAVKDRAQIGNLQIEQSPEQDSIRQGQQDVPASCRPIAPGGHPPLQPQSRVKAANEASSPRMTATAHRNGDVVKGKPSQGSGRAKVIDLPSARCSQNSRAEQHGVSPGIQRALKESLNLGNHVSVVCELYGEAVLPWLGLDRVGGVFL